MRRGRKHETAAAKRARLDFYEEVLGKGGCQIPLPHKCSGPMDPCHVIPKSYLKWHARFDLKLPESEQLKCVWDARNGIPGCRNGHNLMDSPFHSVPADAFPDEVFDFVIEYSCEWKFRSLYAFGERAA